MAEQIPPEIDAQIQAFALNNPHQLYIADRILKIDINQGISSVTLGNTVPNGQVIAVVTITASTEKLFGFANAISEEIKRQAENIKVSQEAFLEKLK